MTIIRVDKREEWIPPIDTEVFNEQIHLNALSDILTMDFKADIFKKMTNKNASKAETQEYLVFVSLTAPPYFDLVF